MENIEIVLTATSAAIGLLITTLTFLKKFLTAAKEKSKAQGMVEMDNAIIPFIENAESFICSTGAQKKEYVLNKAQQYAKKRKIEVNIERVSEKIEELIEFSKLVNARERSAQLSFLDAITDDEFEESL